MTKDALLKLDAALIQPYEKCMQYGASSLSDAELLAVIIRSGKRGKTATELAEEVLRLSPGNGLLGLFHLSLQDLMQVDGIGCVKALQLLSVAELSKRIQTKRFRNRLCFSDPQSIAEYFMERLRHEEREQIYAVFLDSRNRWLGECLLSKGTANAAQLSVRELYREALRYRALRLILVHNHPSGDPSPSMEDLGITKRAKEAGRLLGLELTDHVIIGDGCFCSLLQEGHLAENEDKVADGS